MGLEVRTIQYLIKMDLCKIQQGSTVGCVISTCLPVHGGMLEKDCGPPCGGPHTGGPYFSDRNLVSLENTENMFSVPRHIWNSKTVNTLRSILGVSKERYVMGQKRGRKKEGDDGRCGSCTCMTAVTWTDNFKKQGSRSKTYFFLLSWAEACTEASSLKSIFFGECSCSK